ncbi:MAG: translation elongation factor Ts [Verrucomicrobia bacterium]|nr:translation elongation factor Ts [Verrucomicrobiota bacterium]
MAEISAQIVKKLREETGAGMMECKKALGEANGDFEKAKLILRKRGIAIADKKSARAAKEGIIASYIHVGDKVGVLVEVNCESDFVGRNPDFREFVKNITLQIAAAEPRYVSREDVPAAIIEREKEVAAAQVKNKPPQAVAKILEGKLDKFYQTVCLLEQGYVRDQNQTIKDVITATVAKLGENILIRRFIRWKVGESLDTAQPAAETPAQPAQN